MIAKCISCAFVVERSRKKRLLLHVCLVCFSPLTWDLWSSPCSCTLICKDKRGYFTLPFHLTKLPWFRWFVSLWLTKKTLKISEERYISNSVKLRSLEHSDSMLIVFCCCCCCKDSFNCIDLLWTNRTVGLCITQISRSVVITIRTV